MGVNKIEYNTPNGKQILIDLTGDTVSAGTLAEGKTAHDASGNIIVGTMPTTDSLVEFSQMNSVVTRYMNETTYSPDDYSASTVLPYIYEETDYEKGHPTGHDVNISQGGELHLADEAIVYNMTSSVGVNTIHNAYPGKVSHWWNTVNNNVTHSGTIKPTGQVRMIHTTANNVRDLGGWPCDGGTIKYGMMFRGGLLSAEDRTVLVDQLKIKHDLDLRGKGDNGGLTASPLGADISYTCTDTYVWYSLENEADWKTILRTVFNAVSRNEPIIFHCAAGADRTGTVACIVEAVLGVSQPNLDKDFELTSFSIYPNARQRNSDNWKNLIAEINAVTVGDTFRDKVINWVGYLGFTADEISAFRNAMIDGNPGDITVEEYTPAPPEINYFDVSKAELNKRIGSSGSLSTYNGIVVSDFIAVDSSMRGKRFTLSGVAPVLNTVYGYAARTSFYSADTKAFITGTHTNFTLSDMANGYVHPWLNSITAESAYIRISLVIKDNVAITADDIKDIKITLE